MLQRAEVSENTPVLIRREGDRWYAITKYVLRLDGSLSITERHDITDEMERAC